MFVEKRAIKNQPFLPFSKFDDSQFGFACEWSPDGVDDVVRVLFV